MTTMSKTHVDLDFVALNLTGSTDTESSLYFV
jgi:hypothetical protein